MAKDSSFDVVSQVDMQEIDNAVQQASREVLTRYDLKDSGSSVTFERDTSVDHGDRSERLRRQAGHRHRELEARSSRSGPQGGQLVCA